MTLWSTRQQRSSQGSKQLIEDTQFLQAMACTNQPATRHRKTDRRGYLPQSRGRGAEHADNRDTGSETGFAQRGSSEEKAKERPRTRTRSSTRAKQMESLRRVLRDRHQDHQASPESSTSQSETTTSRSHSLGWFIAMSLPVQGVRRAQD